jgi:hypothetical protein
MKYLVGYEVRVTTDESAELAEQSTSLWSVNKEKCE